MRRQRVGPRESATRHALSAPARFRFLRARFAGSQVASADVSMKGVNGRAILPCRPPVRRVGFACVSPLSTDVCSPLPSLQVVAVSWATWRRAAQSAAPRGPAASPPLPRARSVIGADGAFAGGLRHARGAQCAGDAPGRLSAACLPPASGTARRARPVAVWATGLPRASALADAVAGAVAGGGCLANRERPPLYSNGVCRRVRTSRLRCDLYLA